MPSGPTSLAAAGLPLQGIDLLSEHAACYHACCGGFALRSSLMAEYNAMKHGSRVCAHESRDPLMAAPRLSLPVLILCVKRAPPSPYDLQIHVCFKTL